MSRIDVPHSTNGNGIANGVKQNGNGLSSNGSPIKNGLHKMYHNDSDSTEDL